MQYPRGSRPPSRRARSRESSTCASPQTPALDSLLDDVANNRPLEGSLPSSRESTRPGSRESTRPSPRESISPSSRESTPPSSRESSPPSSLSTSPLTLQEELCDSIS